MSEFTNDLNLPTEFITLEDERSIVAFVADDESGQHRVFYDLEALFYQYAPRIMEAADVAKETDDHDLLMRVAGETLLMEGIRQSVEFLRLEAHYNRA